jgi:hypothetical protein
VAIPTRRPALVSDLLSPGLWPAVYALARAGQLNRDEPVGLVRLWCISFVRFTTSGWPPPIAVLRRLAVAH